MCTTWCAPHAAVAHATHVTPVKGSLCPADTTGEEGTKDCQDCGEGTSASDADGNFITTTERTQCESCDAGTATQVVRCRTFCHRVYPHVQVYSEISLSFFRFRTYAPHTHALSHYGQLASWALPTCAARTCVLLMARPHSLTHKHVCICVQHGVPRTPPRHMLHMLHMLHLSKVRPAPLVNSVWVERTIVLFVPAGHGTTWRKPPRAKNAPRGSTGRRVGRLKAPVLWVHVSIARRAGSRPKVGKARVTHAEATQSILGRGLANAQPVSWVWRRQGRARRRGLLASNVVRVAPAMVETHRLYVRRGSTAPWLVQLRVFRVWRGSSAARLNHLVAQLARTESTATQLNHLAARAIRSVARARGEQRHPRPGPVCARRAKWAASRPIVSPHARNAA